MKRRCRITGLQFAVSVAEIAIWEKKKKTALTSTADSVLSKLEKRDTKMATTKVGQNKYWDQTQGLVHVRRWMATEELPSLWQGRPCSQKLRSCPDCEEEEQQGLIFLSAKT
ncbi:hypothetical protein STEG23_034076, partial [Scotinomys teguina]